MLEDIHNLNSKHPFGSHNLPYGVFSTSQYSKHLCTAIGDYVCDLHLLSGWIDLGVEPSVFQQGCLNPILELPKNTWHQIRQSIAAIFSHGSKYLDANWDILEKSLFRQDSVKMEMPMRIGDYTDFYASKEHATNVGTMFRDKDNPLLPNWLHLPVGYHGRASSVTTSPTQIIRPKGQLMPPGAERPEFGACKRLDFELELGCVIGGGNKLGHPVPIEEAENHIFGYVLVNDWSARDIQKWEYQPLGPFTSKSFATSISPWVITADALDPFTCSGPSQDPEPLQYLQQNPTQKDRSHLDIHLLAQIKPHATDKFETICSTNSRHLYWSMAQMIAHHTSTGCNLNPGDLLASGTISGPEQKSYGSMLELAWGGKKPLTLDSGKTRTFLEDGDKLKLSGICENAKLSVGFGSCEGTIQGAMS